MKLFPLLALISLLCVPGCSTFNYEWRREVRHGVPTNDITGAWDGKWVSDVNGHNGALRCIISPATNGQYSARFYATYQHVLHFGYTLPLDARSVRNRSEFEGSANLGKLFGVYHYKGHATPTNFSATYKMKYDRGVLEMQRPKASP